MSNSEILPADPAAPPGARVPRKGAPLLLVLLATSYCFAYLDRLMMAVVAEPVKHEFGLSDKQLFLLTGAAFVLIYGLCGILAGWMLDRYSRRKIIGIALAAWSVFTAFCGLANNFVQMALARAGVGVGESAIVPAAMAVISDTYAPEKRPMAMAIFYAGGMVGIFLAWVAGGWVAANFGWRYAFFLAGPPGLVLALLVFWLVKEPPREAPRPAAARAAGEVSTFRQVLGHPPLMWVIWAGAILTFVNVGLVGQLGSFFIRSHDMTVQEVGLIFGPIMAVGMALGMFVGGWLGNRLAQRGVGALVKFSSLNAFLMFPLYMLIFLAPSKELALAATFAGTFASILYSPSFSAAYQELSPPAARATAAGISGALNAIIGGALTTFLVGALSDHWALLLGRDSLRYAMMVGMVSCLISGVMFIRAHRLIVRPAKPAFAG